MWCCGVGNGASLRASSSPALVLRVERWSGGEEHVTADSHPWGLKEPWKSAVEAAALYSIRSPKPWARYRFTVCSQMEGVRKKDEAHSGSAMAMEAEGFQGWMLRMLSGPALLTRAAPHTAPWETGRFEDAQRALICGSANSNPIASNPSRLSFQKRHQIVVSKPSPGQAIV